MGWLHTMHVRSSVARGRVLQAERVAAVQRRGIDDLPEELRNRATNSVPGSFEPLWLQRAFRVTMTAFLDEIRYEDADLAARLAIPLNLVASFSAEDGSKVKVYIPTRR
jgi:hypothetical protein